MNTAARKAAALNRTSTDALIGAALILDGITAKTEEQRMVSAWTCDEIERRMGGVQDDDAFLDLLDSGLTYTEALIATFPALAA